MVLRARAERIPADKIVFFICFAISATIGIVGFCMPPEGEIDASVLKFIALMLAFATIAVGAQAIKDGRKATIKHGETEINVNGTGE